MVIFFDENCFFFCYKTCVILFGAVYDFLNATKRIKFPLSSSYIVSEERTSFKFEKI